MRNKQLVPIFREICSFDPRFSFHKSTLFFHPIGMLLQAVDLNPSGFSKDYFDVNAFCMPLCVPEEHLTMTFGISVNLPGQVWSMKLPDLSTKLYERITDIAIPHLQARSTLRDFAAQVRHSGNPHGPKSAAYSLARIGDTAEAISLIEDYLPKLRPWPPWEVQIGEESRALRHLLIYEPALAAEKLVAWENETIRNLGLERFR